MADFNRDGKLDLVITNRATNTIAILLGNGNGTFGSPVSIPLVGGQFPTDVAVGDFNGDGNTDIVVANGNGPSAIGVFLGRGDGGFQTEIDSPSGTSPLSLAIGDFDKDSRLDVVVGGNGVSTVLLGKGDGSFKTPITFNLGQPNQGSATFGVGVADFNRDGKLDFVGVGFGSLQDNIAIVLGNGDGTFGSPNVFSAVFSEPDSVAVGDFNNDSKPDLLVSYVFGGGAMFLGNGDGSFQQFRNGGFGGNGNGTGTSVVAADFNLDGKLDFAATDQAQNTLFVDTGNGTGASIAELSLTTGTGPVGMAVGDLNGDGIPDIAVANFNSNTISIFLNQTTVPRGIALTASPATQTVKAGQTAQYTLQVAAQGAFSGTVTFSCSNLPTGAGCNFSPASLGVSGGSPSSTTVSITTASTLAALASPQRPGTFASLTISFLQLICFSSAAFRRRKRAFGIAAVILLCAFGTACGGGSKPAPQPNPGPTGTFTVTVTASSGSVTQSSNLTLIVQ